jgi:hypothetical protein
VIAAIIETPNQDGSSYAQVDLAFIKLTKQKVVHDESSPMDQDLFQAAMRHVASQRFPVEDPDDKEQVIPPPFFFFNQIHVLDVLDLDS